MKVPDSQRNKVPWKGYGDGNGPARKGTEPWKKPGLSAWMKKENQGIPKGKKRT